MTVKPPKDLTLPGLIPPGRHWFIAGGYAACPALAGDIDIWILAHAEDLAAVRDAVLAHLKAIPIWVNEEDATEVGTGYDEMPLHTRKVGRMFLFGKHVHLMVTDATSPLEVLQNFDISTHHVAILPTGNVIEGPYFTPPHVPPRQLMQTSRTRERMVKICTRFGHDPKLYELDPAEQAKERS